MFDVHADEDARCDTIVSLALTHGLKAELRRVAQERCESMSAVARAVLARELGKPQYRSKR